MQLQASKQEVVQAAAGARTEMHKSRQLANGSLEEKRADTFGHKLINIFWDELEGQLGVPITGKMSLG